MTSKDKIRDFFMPDILKLVANKQYWRQIDDKKEDLVCAYCQKKIDIPSLPDHFLLWTHDESYFLTLHFKCAFRKIYLSEIQDVFNLIEQDSIEEKYFRKTGVFPDNFRFKYDFKTHKMW